MTGSLTTPLVPLSALEAFCTDVLCSAGVPTGEAALVAASLTGADARNIPSHGVVRLLPVYVSRLENGSTRSAPSIRVVQRRGATALVDGDSGLGQVVGHEAMRLAVTMAREQGAGIVGVRNSSHFGTGAFFVDQAVKDGMIGLALSNAPANMPPAGGRSRFFGTNPLTIGAPGADDRPIVLDMATSVVARGKIVMAQKEGRTIPAGWAIDPDGNPTEDPEAALRGAVLAMAGYKGAGLALMIDMLCGVLTGAAFGPHIVDLYDDSGTTQNVGHFFAAIDVQAFMPLAAFRERVGQFADEVRGQPRLPGVDAIYLPGELELAAAERARRDGIAIAEAGWHELDALAQRLAVPPLGERLPLSPRSRGENLIGRTA